MSYNLANKLALITGAASGIGRASATLFASKAADLALVDKSPQVTQIAQELKAKHPDRNITAHISDVTISSKIEKLFDEIKNQHSNYHCPSVLVNSAGIARTNLLVDISEKEFDEIINANLKGTFLITQSLVKKLVSNYANVKFDSPTQSYASIINFSSAAQYGAASASHYAITKAGVDAFAKSISKEYGRMRIRCNTILPFFIETPMVHSVMTDSKRAMYEAYPSLKRFGQPHEVAELVYFLATDSSSYITGASLDINGGI